MAPEIKTHTFQLRTDSKPFDESNFKGFDFSTINCWTDASKAESFLSARLKEVRLFNAPIEDEIAERKEEIKKTRKMERFYKSELRSCDDPTQISWFKNKIAQLGRIEWRLVCDNVHDAFNLQRV